MCLFPWETVPFPLYTHHHMAVMAAHRVISSPIICRGFLSTLRFLLLFLTFLSSSSGQQTCSFISNPSACPAGKFNPDSSQPITECITCLRDPSVYCPEGACFPYSVQPGFFSEPEKNQLDGTPVPRQSITECPAGYYCANGVRVVCSNNNVGVNYYCPTMNLSYPEVIEIGYYKLDRQTKEICPAGSYCVGESQVFPNPISTSSPLWFSCRVAMELYFCGSGKDFQALIVFYT